MLFDLLLFLKIISISYQTYNAFVVFKEYNILKLKNTYKEAYLMDDPAIIIKPDKNKYIANIIIYFIIAQFAFNFMIMTNIFIESKKFYTINFIIIFLLVIYILFTVLYIFLVYKFIVIIKEPKIIRLYKDTISIGLFTSDYKNIYLKIRETPCGKMLIFKTPNQNFIYEYIIKDTDLDIILKKIKVYEKGLFV